MIHGYPATEANAVEMARALAHRYTGRIVWLDGPERAYLSAIDIPVERIEVVGRNTIRGILSYVVAEVTFFTHGLYGTPPAVGRKPTVNLWHGEAIKNFDPLLPDRHARGRPYDYHVGATRLLGQRSVQVAGTPPPQLLLTGYPRIAALRRDCTDGQLEALGIDVSRPFVIWMPTFRQTKSVSSSPGFQDTLNPSVDLELARLFSNWVSLLVGSGIQVVVKPHPLDSSARDAQGAVLLDDHLLTAAGVQLYSVLGRADGLITDFSSVATDFLHLDRPVAYFFPDLESYLGGRGVYPHDALEHLAGPQLHDEPSVRAFIDDVLSAGEASREKRAAARDWFGLVSAESSAERLLDELDARIPSLRTLVSRRDPQAPAGLEGPT
ncbi:hypothetical protein GCM10009788_24740 [Nocardioides humi]|uniref:CDP-glycerol glycerophosphotransferase, TagB/SpsB family n=1 Tax=Nocardioides humi TaxID=449461 RepID=A0ABN2AIN9_9ACTN